MHKVIQQIKQQTKQILNKFCEVTKLTSQQKSSEVIYNSLRKSSLDSIIRNAHNLRVVGISASAMLAIVMTLTTAPIVIHSSIAEAAGGVASTTTLTMTSANNNLDLNLTVLDTDGTFATSKAGEEATFNITTNNYTGYNLTISAASDTGTLTNTTDGSVLSSINAIMGKSEFDTASNNGKWGFKPSKYNSVNNEAYIPAPTTDAIVLDKTTTANAAANSYTIGLGARIDYTTSYGTYTGNFILAAVANPVPYAINFVDTSGDDTVKGMPEALTGTADSEQVKLPTNIPIRNDYEFNGWCDTIPTVDGEGISSCSGTTYQASTLETPSYIGIDQTISTNTSTLYALWNKEVKGAHSITIKTATGISKVALNGTECTSASGCSVDGLSEGKGYDLSATVDAGYSFSSWNPGNYGSITDTTAVSTTYIVGQGSGIVAPSTTPNKYNITIKTTTGISSVSLNGTSCTSTSGCVVQNLEYDKSYPLVATKSSGYDLASWNAGNYGTIANTSAASTTYTVGLGASTITPSSKTCTQSISGTMQTYTTAVSSLCSDASGTLTDNRDNSQYKVAKLADGKVWMLDNLRLGSTSAISLTTSNTNIASNWTLPAGITSGFASYDTAQINVASKDTTVTSYGSGSGKVGVYYNYCAASAGTYCYASSSDSGGDASYDICPKGWRMPTGGSGGEYQLLYTAYGSNDTNFSDALSTPYSGQFYTSSANYQGSSGRFWSSTRYNNYMRYTLFIDASTLNPQSNGGRRYGYPVRCVLR